MPTTQSVKNNVKSKLSKLKSKITAKSRSTKKPVDSKRVSTIHLVGNKKRAAGRATHANR